MAGRGDAPSLFRVELRVDARQLDHELMNRCMVSSVIPLPLPPYHIHALPRRPQPLVVCPTIGKGTGNAYGTDRIQLVGIEEDFRLQRLRLRRGAKAVGEDRMTHSRHTLRGQATLQEQRLGPPSGLGSMVARARTTPPVMEKHSRAEDAPVGPLYLRNMLGKGQHPQDMVEIVDAISLTVEPTHFVNG